MRSVFLFVLTAILLSACSSYGPLESTRGDWLDRTAKITNPSALVLSVDDAQERNGEVAYGSGLFCQLEFKYVMEEKGIKVIVSDCKSLEEATVKAQEESVNYIIKISMVEWENNATEWSGEPDVAAINFEVFSAESGEKVAAAFGRKRGTCLSAGPGKPDRFVNYIANEIVDKLFNYLD